MKFKEQGALIIKHLFIATAYTTGVTRLMWGNELSATGLHSVIGFAVLINIESSIDNCPNSVAIFTAQVSSVQCQIQCLLLSQFTLEITLMHS